jgi:hypothetical protein
MGLCRSLRRIITLGVELERDVGVGVAEKLLVVFTSSPFATRRLASDRRNECQPIRLLIFAVSAAGWMTFGQSRSSQTGTLPDLTSLANTQSSSPRYRACLRHAARASASPWRIGMGLRDALDLPLVRWLLTTMAHPVTAKIATDSTRKIAGMSVDQCAARVDEIVTTPGSRDDPTLMLELIKCISGPDADLPEVSPAEQAACDTYVEETYTPEWFKTATRID